MTSFYQ